MQNNDSRKHRGNAKLVGSLLLVITVLLSAWIAVAHFHIALLQEYITSINPNGSVLRVTLIASFGGFILSIPILRSLSPNDRTSNVKVEPIPHYRNPRVHPLFMTSRPAGIRILLLGKQRIGEESRETALGSDFHLAIRRRTCSNS